MPSWQKILAVLALLAVLGLTWLGIQRRGLFSGLGSEHVDVEPSESNGVAAYSESLSAPETRPESDEGEDRRERVLDAGTSRGLTIRYRDGAPVSGIGVYAVEKSPGGPRRNVVAGASGMLTETSELGVLVLSADVAREGLRGFALALSARSALILPMDELVEGGTLTVDRLVPQDLLLMPPQGAQLNEGQRVEVQIGSKGDAGFTAPWAWGAGQAPRDLFGEYHLTSADPIDEMAHYIAEPVVFSDGALEATVLLPQTPCFTHLVSAPFGWELAGSTISREFRPSPDALELRFHSLELRRLRVRSSSGGLWPSPDRVFLASKALAMDGSWSTQWELELDAEPSALIEGETEFIVPSEHEMGAAAIIAEYGEGRRLESEVYPQLPEYVEIGQ